MYSSTTVLSITTNLSRYGGAQKVLLDVHNGIKTYYNAKIIGFQKYSNLHRKYYIPENEYVRFKHPWQLQNKIVIVHARNVIPFIVLLKKIFRLNTKVLYVSHNVYQTYKCLTLFPDHIISISNRVTENLVSYFNQNPKKINLIYNGLKDESKIDSDHEFRKSNIIKILYPARVNHVKRQLEIVKHLKGKLHENIKIHFAGVGDDFEELISQCKADKNFVPLGFIENISQVITDYDFVMLYSRQEGLPLSLIEGIMHGKPLLVNDVGGNLEIGEPEKNGIILSEDWQLLSQQLNSLNTLTKEGYNQMSIKSRELYLNKFQYDIMIEKYLQLISKIN